LAFLLLFLLLPLFSFCFFFEDLGIFESKAFLASILFEDFTSLVPLLEGLLAVSLELLSSVVLLEPFNVDEEHNEEVEEEEEDETVDDIKLSSFMCLSLLSRISI
jgi:hypothetical protein